MSIAKQIWSGELSPMEHVSPPTPEYMKVVDKLEQAELRLKAALDEDTRKLLDEYSACYDDYLATVESEAFEIAFHLGVNLLLESLGYTR